jgi:hypothetical protein
VPLSCAQAPAALTAAITVMSGIRIRRGVIGSLYSNEYSMKPGKQGQGGLSQLIDLAAAAALVWTGPRSTQIESIESYCIGTTAALYWPT